MILLFLSWLNDNYKAFNVLFKSKGNGRTLFLLFLALFIWQAIGLFYSENTSMAWRNLSSRLAFLMFPLILFNPATKIKSGMNNLLRVFSVAASAYLISCFVFALYRSVNFQDGALLFNSHPPEADWDNYFYSDLLTYSVHPSYMAMYTILGFFISLESAKDKLLKKSARIIWLISGLFLLVSLYFISSRAALLAMIIIVPFYIIYNLIIFKRSKYIGISLIVLILVSVPLILKNERYKSFIDFFKRDKNSELQFKDDRIIIWNSAFKVVQDNIIFGAGIGDVRDELVKVYDQIAAERLSTNRTNAHNQFLEVLLESGIIGLLFFLAIISFMIYIAITGKNLVYGFFIITMLVFFMFESALYRFAGVSFFSLFSFLLIYDKNIKGLMKE
ncbi:MAG: O-antigen ligase family protein [Bacteroidales bacterium]|nr:O-antigen ligase family protein [Bacteroidales bacterium]